LNNEKLVIIPNFKPVATPIQKYRKRTLQRITQQGRDTIEALRKVPYTVNREMWDVYQLFADGKSNPDLMDIFKVRNPMDYVKELRPTIEGEFTQKVESYRKLKDFIGLIKRHDINAPVYFDWFIAGNDRIHLNAEDGVDIQNDTLHRFMVNPGNPVTITPELMHQFKISVLSGLKLEGTATGHDKYDSNTESEVNTRFEQALNEFRDIDITKKNDTLKKFLTKNGAHGLMSLMALKAYKPEGGFTVRLVNEFDQVTSGSSNSSLLLSKDTTLLQRAGYFSNSEIEFDGTNQQGTYTSYMDFKAKNNLDNYQAVQAGIEALIGNATLPTFNGIKEELGIKIDRDFAKGPTTIFNYQAGPNRIKSEQAERIYISLLEYISELAVQGKTKELEIFSDKLKERLNRTISAKIKELRVKEDSNSAGYIKYLTGMQKYLNNPTKHPIELSIEQEDKLINSVFIPSYAALIFKHAIQMEVGNATVTAIEAVFQDLAEKRKHILALTDGLYRLHAKQYKEALTDQLPSINEQKRLFTQVANRAVVKTASSTGIEDSLQLGKLVPKRTGGEKAHAYAKFPNGFYLSGVQLNINDEGKVNDVGYGNEVNPKTNQKGQTGIGISELQYVYEAPGASAITNMIQGIDGHNMQSVIIKLVEKHGFIPIHDAIVGSFETLPELATKLNEMIFKTTSGTYNPVQGIYANASSLSDKIFEAIDADTTLKKPDDKNRLKKAFDEALSEAEGIIRIIDGNVSRMSNKEAIVSSVPYPGGNFNIRGVLNEVPYTGECK
jgi:hypothetical protein